MQPNDEQGSEAERFENPDTATEEQQITEITPVSWTASEFIAHQKDPVWYGVAIGSLVVICGAIFLVTKDLISVITIVAAGILFLVASTKKPQQQPYTVDHQGISIGEKFYPYSMFKSFVFRQEGAIGTVSFMPLRRLMPEISIYFAPEDEERIIDILAASLPNDQRAEHPFDRLTKRLHF
ncbi:MAG: hypothetical protein ACR2FM_02365 [Candidatus Saccharimonadales bacterium]